jgi:hypothetical protein
MWHKLLQEHIMKKSEANSAITSTSRERLHNDRTTIISDIAHLRRQSDSYGGSSNMFSSEADRLCRIRDDMENIIS